MRNVSRREFLGSTLAAAGTVALSHTKSSGRVIGANDTVAASHGFTSRPRSWAFMELPSACRAPATRMKG